MDVSREFVTMRQAAEIAGKGFTGIERWIAVGVYDMPPLPCQVVGKVRLIKRTDLMQYAAKVKNRADGRSHRHHDGQG